MKLKNSQTSHQSRMQSSRKILTYNEGKSQLIKTDQGVTQMKVIVTKTFKQFLNCILHAQKAGGKLSRHMENKHTQKWTSRKENYNVQDEKNALNRIKDRLDNEQAKINESEDRALEKTWNEMHKNWTQH